MVGLLDIAPSTRTVPVEGQEISVHGVSATGIAYLLTKFPALRELVGRGEISSITTDDLVKVVPEAIASIIACGCGYPANAEAEQRAALLPLEAQLDLLKAIVELTMPKGVGPFMEKLVEVMSGLDVRLKAPATPSPSPSSS